MLKAKNYDDINKIYDIMNTTQSNYSNMLKRLKEKRLFRILLLHIIALL